MRVPAAITGEFHRLGTAVREKRMTIEQALKEIAQICVDRHEHFGLMLAPINEAPAKTVALSESATITDAERLAAIARKWCPDAALRCVSAIEEALAPVAPSAGGTITPPPPMIRAALLVLLGHVEPGWDNCKWIVQEWMEGRLSNAAPQVSPSGDASALAVTPPRPAEAASSPQSATVECPECNVRFDPTWDRRPVGPTAPKEG